MLISILFYLCIFFRITQTSNGPWACPGQGNIPTFSAPAVPIQRVGIQFTEPVGIDYHQASNQVLMSVNYWCGYSNCNTNPPSGTAQNFALIQFDGTQVPFSNVGKLTDEVKIACVRQTTPPNPQFPVGECFSGNGNSGGVLRLSADGLTVYTNWVTLPYNPGLLRGGLYVDNWNLYQGQVAIATKDGYVFLVNAQGTVTFVGSTPSNLLAGQSPWLEGIIIVPDTPGQYGISPEIAGKILTGDQTANCYIWIFYPNNPGQTPTVYPMPLNIEDIDVIFPNENFFGVNYSQQRLLGAAAQYWAQYANYILLTQEFFPSNQGGLYILDWSSGSPSAHMVNLDTSALANVGGAITQWEHVTFASAGILEIPPATPICFLWRDVTTAPFNLYPFGISTNVATFYDYNSAQSPWTSNFFNGLTTVTPSISSVNFHNSITIMPVIDMQNLISLVIQVDDKDGSGGSLEFSLNSTNWQPSIGAYLLQQDDPSASSPPSGVDYADSFLYSNGAGFFSWEWGPNTADGVVISPLLVAGLNQGICFDIQIVLATGVSNLQLLYSSASPTSGTGSLQTHTVALSSFPSQTFTICIYDCSYLCFLFNECTGCAANVNCTWCQSTQQCLQAPVNTSTCPVQYNVNTNYCPCSDYSSSCEDCSENPYCGWCCTNGGAGGSCVSGNSSASSTCTSLSGTWEYHTCSSLTGCNPPCARGACVCGQCQCPPQWTGPTCNTLIGCDGVPGSNMTVDICGVCGGNGTSCLGCNGQPFGPTYDQCGVCGGDGTECINICPYQDCVSCARSYELCYWCYTGSSGNAGTCNKIGLQNCSGTAETNYNSGRCQGTTIPTVAVVAGTISGAIVAAIIVVIIVCLALSALGGTAAYKVYMKNRRTMGTAQSNPMYVESKNTGTNPMFEEK
jgi:hypothetical protein